MFVTMEFKVEQQITQPDLGLAVLETCYVEPIIEEACTTEEVQIRSHSQKQGQTTKEFDLSSRNNSIWDRRTSKENKIRLWIRLHISVQQGKQPALWF